MEKKLTHREHARKHIDKKLRNRLRLYFIIAAIMVAIVIYNLLFSKLDFILSLLGVVGGIILGVVSSRMFHISWDHDGQKVVSQLDLIGGIVLVVYILFELGSEFLIKHYLSADITGAFTFAFITGGMIGRVLGTRGKIVKVLREQLVFVQ